MFVMMVFCCVVTGVGVLLLLVVCVGVVVGRVISTEA